MDRFTSEGQGHCYVYCDVAILHQWDATNGGGSSNDCFVAYHLRMIVNENQSVQFRCIILV